VLSLLKHGVCSNISLSLSQCYFFSGLHRVDFFSITDSHRISCDQNACHLKRIVLADSCKWIVTLRRVSAVCEVTLREFTASDFIPGGGISRQHFC